QSGRGGTGDPVADAEDGGEPAADEDGGEPPARAARRRACPTCGVSRLSRGLELTAPVTTLLGLSQHPGQLGSWGPVIAEVARNLLADLVNAPWRISLTDDHGRVIWHGPVRIRPNAEDLRRRHPTRAQAAFIRARDRRCRHPGCSRPAACAQIDHTQPHAAGGPTCVSNLECLCVRHHLLKTLGLWQAHQSINGVISFTSALGRRYLTHPEPIDEHIDELLQHMPE